MKLLGLVTAVSLVACVGVNETFNDREHCFAAGDTAQLTPVLLPDSLIVACGWGVVTDPHCFSVPVTRYTQSDCVVGSKWKWPK